MVSLLSPGQSALYMSQGAGLMGDIRGGLAMHKEDPHKLSEGFKLGSPAVREQTTGGGTHTSLPDRYCVSSHYHS